MDSILIGTTSLWKPIAATSAMCLAPTNPLRNRAGRPLAHGRWPRLYNQIVREVAMQKGDSVDDNARLFAFVNTAMGDAGILAWDQKYIHDGWRPVIGVREHDGSMGPAACHWA